MKVALITDTHFGVRNDSPPFLEMTERFLRDVFFPTVDRRMCRQVIHLGDLLDRRKYVNFRTASSIRNNFVNPLHGRVDRFDMILGNHDEYHRNTGSVNGPTELYAGFSSDMFRIHQDPVDAYLLDGTPALFLPWITDDNREWSLEAIKDTRAQLCFGHLELSGFEMYRGHEATEGMEPSLFGKFDMTFSGHYHHKSSKNGIHYLGAHGEFTWGDYDDPRGFHVFDTQTRELEFIPNPYTMFEKLHYEEDIAFNKDADLSGKYVKVIVRERQDQVKFEQFISSVERCNPADIQVVDDHLNAGDLIEALEDIDESEDTLSIFRRVLDPSELGVDAERLDKFITGLYAEALSLE